MTDYKLIYETKVDGEARFAGSESGIPNAEADTIFKLTREELENYTLVYSYKGKVYATTEKVPAYDENGMPTDLCLDETAEAAGSDTTSATEENTTPETEDETEEPESTEPESTDPEVVDPEVTTEDETEE